MKSLGIAMIVVFFVGLFTFIAFAMGSVIKAAIIFTVSVLITAYIFTPIYLIG